MKIKEIALFHAKTNIHKERVNQAHRIIHEALAICPSWYVGFSGGKDSTVVAYLTSLHEPGVPLLYGDEEWLLPETEAYMDRTYLANPKRFHRIKAADTHAEWFSVWQDDLDAIHSDNASGVYAKLQGWQGCFLGLRQEENSRRKTHLRKRGPLFFSEKDRVWQCNPIHNWTWQDVWALLVSENVDYNRAYDRLEEIGIEPKRQRIGPLAQERVLGYGQLAILKRGWPELFNRFVEKYPQAGSYV